MGNAIVARLGIDSAGFRAGLAQAQNQIDGFKRKNSGGSAGGHGGKGNNNQVIGDTINAVTGGSGAVTELNNLTHLLPAAAGAMGGVAVAALVAYKSYEAWHESIVKVREANDAAAKSFGDMDSAIVGGGVSALTTKLGEMEGLIAKLRETRGFASQLGAAFGGTDDADSKKAELELEKRRSELIEKSGEKIREQTASRLAAQQAGEREVAMLKIREQAEEKIAAINGDSKLHGTGLAPKLINQANADASAAMDDVNAKMDAKEREVSLQREIASLTVQFVDAEDHILKARIRAAELELELARSPEAKDTAEAQLATAKAQLVVLERKRQSDQQEHDRGQFVEFQKSQSDSAQGYRDQEREQFIDFRKQQQSDREKKEAEAKKRSDRVSEERKKMGDSITDRSKLTLGELAGQGHGKDANAARRAQRLYDRARKHALHGNARPDLIAKGDAIRDGIGSLKDSDKTNTAFKAALDACKMQTVLESIQKDGIPIKVANL